MLGLIKSPQIISINIATDWKQTFLFTTNLQPDLCEATVRILWRNAYQPLKQLNGLLCHTKLQKPVAYLITYQNIVRHGSVTINAHVAGIADSRLKQHNVGRNASLSLSLFVPSVLSLWLKILTRSPCLQFCSSRLIPENKTVRLSLSVHSSSSWWNVSYG